MPLISLFLTNPDMTLLILKSMKSYLKDYEYHLTPTIDINLPLFFYLLFSILLTFLQSCHLSQIKIHPLYFNIIINLKFKIKFCKKILFIRYTYIFINYYIQP